MGFNNSKIANSGSRTYCNTFLDIFGSPNKSAKHGTSDPLFITEIFQKLDENKYGTFYKKYYVCKLGNLRFAFCLEANVPTFFEIQNNELDTKITN